MASFADIEKPNIISASKKSKIFRVRDFSTHLRFLVYDPRHTQRSANVVNVMKIYEGSNK